MTGKIDLLVELPDNKVVALDMKWRGDNHYARTLREGGHLQLALYSSLVEQKTGTAPAALGFFILESGALFISHSGLFPQAQFIPPRGRYGRHTARPGKSDLVLENWPVHRRAN